MRLEQLSYLVEVAENNSINTAAGKLFLTPQNISKAIKQLEEELHVQLFTRSKYGMFLTAEGQLVYDTAKDILKKIQFLHNTFSDDCVLPADDIQGPLSITASADMGLTLNRLICQIIKQHRGINILYSEKESALIYEQLKDSSYYDSCDLLFLSCGKNQLHKYVDFKDKFDIYLLKDEYLCVLMNTQSPYAKQQSISLKTLATLPIATFSSFAPISAPQKCFISELLADYNIRLNIVFTTDSFSNYDRYVADGIAYGLVGSDYMSNASKMTNANRDIITVPLKEKIITTHLLLVNKIKAPTSQQQYFVSAVKNHYAANWHSL